MWHPTHLCGARFDDFDPDPEVTPVVRAALSDLEGVGAVIDDPGVDFAGLKDYFWALNGARAVVDAQGSSTACPSVSS